MSRPLRDLAWTAFWTVVCLAAIDVGIARLLPMPADPTQRARPLADYFQFGRSIEAKLRRMMRASPEASSPRMRAGWLEPAEPTDAPRAARPGTRLLTVYGQSFTFQVLDAFTQLDSGWTVRRRGGPASPASHGFALWSVDRPRVHSDVAVLGVLASSVQALTTNNAGTWEFEAPPAYTYPRYRLGPGDSLAAAPPLVRSWADLRATLDDPARLRAWQAQMARDDAWYDPLLWRASWADHSTLASLLRRAWAQRAQRAQLARVHGRQGFRPDCEQVPVLRALLARFVRECRADGTVPAVLLFEDAGYSGHLRTLVGPGLDSLGVVWLASSELVDSNDPANLKGDAHFVPEANRRLAEEFSRRLAASLARLREAKWSASEAASTEPDLVRPNTAK